MSRIRYAGPGRRLFVATHHDGARTFVLAESVLVARGLEPTARAATDADVRSFLDEHALGPTEDVTTRLSVSRQTLFHWRRRAGMAAPARSDRARSEIVDCLREGLRVEVIAKRCDRHPTTIRRIARETGVVIERNDYPPDVELVELARGNDWSEVAKRLRRSVNTTRAFVYKRPELARAMRAVMARKAPRSTSC